MSIAGSVDDPIVVLCQRGGWFFSIIPQSRIHTAREAELCCHSKTLIDSR